MTDLVERCARAAWEAHDKIFAESCGFERSDWSRTSEAVRDDYRAMAMAVLAEAGVTVPA